MSLSLLFISASARRVLLLFSVFLLLAVPMVHAQAPEWQTVVAANRISGTFAEVVASATNAEGDVYVVGTFDREISFDTTTILTAGVGDAFIAKWSTSGRRFVWALPAGGADFDYATAVAVSGANVFIGGGLRGNTANFGDVIVNRPQENITGFVAKLVDAGSTASFKWVQTLSTEGASSVEGLAASGANVYVAGSVGGAANFNSTSLPSSGGIDVVVAKLVDTGDTSYYSWAQRAGGTGYDTPTAIAVSGTSLYVAGYFTSPTATFGLASLLNANASGELGDVFITKLTDAGTTGSFIWSQRAGGTGSDFATAIALHETNVFVAGSFTSTSSRFGNITLTNADVSGTTRDVFVAKLADAGLSTSFTWVQRAGNTGSESLNALAVKKNSVYLAGGFDGATTVFGSTTLTNSNSRLNTNDMFLTKLTDVGTTSSFNWAQQAGGGGADYAGALALSGTNVYLSGYIASTAQFGSQSIPNTAAFTRVAFLASLSDGEGLAAKMPTPLAGLSLVPNPAHTTVTLRVPALPNTANISLALYDALGRVVKARVLPQPTASLAYELSVADLTPGVYTVQVQAGAVRSVHRLVVE